MARRRPLTGRPLLLASTGLALTVGCGRKSPPVGNLMAPPTVSAEVCVDVAPPEAAAMAVVVVNGTVATDRCTTVSAAYGGPIRLDVSAIGYTPQLVEVPVADAGEPVAVTLEVDPYFGMEPVGNLMSPQ